MITNDVVKFKYFNIFPIEIKILILNYFSSYFLISKLRTVSLKFKNLIDRILNFEERIKKDYINQTITFNKIENVNVENKMRFFYFFTGYDITYKSLCKNYAEKKVFSNKNTGITAHTFGFHGDKEHYSIGIVYKKLNLDVGNFFLANNLLNFPVKRERLWKKLIKNDFRMHFQDVVNIISNDPSQLSKKINKNNFIIHYVSTVQFFGNDPVQFIDYSGLSKETILDIFIPRPNLKSSRILSNIKTHTNRRFIGKRKSKIKKYVFFTNE